MDRLAQLVCDVLRLSFAHSTILFLQSVFQRKGKEFHGTIDILIVLQKLKHAYNVRMISFLERLDFALEKRKVAIIVTLL